MDKSLELRFEQIKNFGNLRMKLLKSFYDGQSILESYTNGDSVIHIHGRTVNNSFCTTVRNAISDAPMDECEFAMFVWIRDTLENLCPLASVARLQILDDCDMFITDTSEKYSLSPIIQSSYPSIETLHRSFDRKLCTLHDLLGVKLGQLIDEIIETSPQVVDSLPNKKRDDIGNRLKSDLQISDNYLNRTSIRQFDCGWLSIDDNTIVYNLGKNPNPPFQITQVLFSPSDPLISAIQRLHSAIIQRHGHIVEWKTHENR